jgi:hypothetical protein
VRVTWNIIIKLCGRIQDFLMLQRNLVAQAQRPDFVLHWNGRVHLNRWGRQFSRLVGETVFRAKWSCTGYTLHSPVSPSLPLPCDSVCHQVPRALYYMFSWRWAQWYPKHVEIFLTTINQLLTASHWYWIIHLLISRVASRATILEELLCQTSDFLSLQTTGAPAHFTAVSD